MSDVLISEKGLESSLAYRKMAPSGSFWLGTDALGRDMLTRTIKGLCSSLELGLLAAFFSTVIAASLGIIAATCGRIADYIISGLIDLFMSIPHLVLLILISFTLGGGVRGVVIAVAISHWPRLSRVIRAEVLQLKNSEFILISRKMGKSQLWIALNHLFPHISSQFIIGITLLVPHAILHSAGLTFLGFGLSPHSPSIGILLSESMRHLSTGCWWLAIFPGIGLVITVKIFDIMGRNLRTVLDPKTKQD
jgi:peptide/nickel transport system permease protein